ncbi:hypothetical protein [Xanthomonas sp. 10-10]|uniref:Integron gene cassette protein n=1 Tax=Xanthomonas sp. 10-10 TaxID=3115848 RepID=A0AAU7P9J1_9XANT
MINAALAASIASTWQQLEAAHGGRATQYMRSILGPAIEIAAKNGQNSLSQEGVSHEFLQDLINAVQALGYGTSLNGHTFTVTW